MAVRLAAGVLPLLTHTPRNEWVPGALRSIGGRWYFVPETPHLCLERIHLATLEQLWEDCYADIALQTPWETACITAFEELIVPTERPA